MGGQQLPINLSGILVAAMLVLAALLHQPPLQSDRPPAARISPEPSGPFENVPARIWEDPFEAIARVPAPTGDDEKSGAGGLSDADASGGPVPSYLRYLSRTNAETRLLIMPVMVSGAPHPAVRESRLRMRVAVHAGLAAAGFPPLRADRIGVWRWRPTGNSDLTVEVPFEAFKQDLGPQRRLVLVLWLNDEVVSRDLGSETEILQGEAAGADASGPLTMIDRMLADLGYPRRNDASGAPSFVCGQTTGAALEGDRTPRPARFGSCAVRVVGPVSSDSLEAMYVELLGWSGGDCLNSYAHIDNGPEHRADDAGGPGALWGDEPVNFKLVSPLATAPWSELVPKQVPDGPVEIRNGQGTRCATLAVQRTVATDDVLIAALVDELQRRGIDPTARSGHASKIPGMFSDFRLDRLLGPGEGPAETARDHVVVVSEWDTKFGRTLPVLFTKEVRRRWCDGESRSRCAGDDDAACAEASRAQCMDRLKDGLPWVHGFSYVRGLDGDVAARAAAAVDKEGKVNILALAAGTDAGFKEPAAGTGQYDYLRRLALQIQELDRSLKQRDQGSIKAFGILGNDYYDKLMILQALKEKFPAHLYFTTDLDAGFLDAKVFRWTRNLVIAAPYGLTLRRSFDGGEDLQGKIPPFRHSYQTALFLTVLRTLQGGEDELGRTSGSDPRDASRVAPEAARVFEVGYGRFFGLTQPDSGRSRDSADRTTHDVDTGADGLEQASMRAAASRHPEPWRSGVREFLGSHALSVALTAMIALVLVPVAAPPLRHRVHAWLGWPRLRGGRKAGGGGAEMENAGESETPEPTPVSRALRVTTPESIFAGYGALIVTLIYLAAALFWLLPVVAMNEEPFAWFSGISIWPSEIVRLLAGWAACLCLIFGWRQVRQADRRIEGRYELGGGATEQGAAPCFSFWRAADDHPRVGVESPPPVPSIAERICKLFGGSQRRGSDAAPEEVCATREWRLYCCHASPAARLRRVLPSAALFWLFAFVLVYGFVDPITPHRGEPAYWFAFFNAWFLVGAPFMVLLFGAVDEALLCSGLLRRLEGKRIRWPVNTHAAGCSVDQQTRGPLGHWITTEFIADRTGPAATVIHLPFIIILFLLLSLSTRFDNWNTPVSVMALIVLSIGIGLLSSLRLRGAARRVRERLVEDLREEVTGIEQAAAPTQSEKLRRLVQRIEAIHDGAYTQWYNEPVFRALAWVLAIGIIVVTEYATVGG